MRVSELIAQISNSLSEIILQTIETFVKHHCLTAEQQKLVNEAKIGFPQFNYRLLTCS